MENFVNYNSHRLLSARFNKSFGKIIKIVAPIIAAVFFVFSIILFLDGKAISWLVLSFSLWFLVPFFWVKRYLDQLPPNKQARTIDDVLEPELLGLLSNGLSQRNLLDLLAKTNSGRFIMARFQLPPDFISQSISESNDLGPVWQESWSIWNSLAKKPDTITGPIVLLALLRNQPGIEQVLKSMRIDLDDLLKGVEWYTHINWMQKVHSQYRLTGGIARDWSFGYTPLLERFGVSLSAKYSSGNRSLSSDLDSTREAVLSMQKILSSSNRRNVALIGPLGSGKSSIVDKFAESLMDASQKLPSNLKFSQVFALDASAIISGANGVGLEQLVNQLMVEAYRAKNIILFLDNAELFFENDTGAVDLSNILQPILEAGGLRLILSMEEHRFLQIAQSKPALSSVLNRIDVKSTNEDDTMTVMQDRIISLQYKNNCLFTYRALKEAWRLSERYINDVAQPRKSVQLLENSIQQAKGNIIDASSIVSTIEKTLGIKVGGAVTEHDSGDEKQRLLNLEDIIHERMINQTSAVKAVASALRRASVGVRNENRPIGTFLFLGPTGVGKTELAKSLASAYFGGEGNMVRIDLNEYVMPSDVARLIADGATDPNSLSAQVQKNPFSVVLLDEIEKAHTNVLTTLLQVLDEGVLRDINNREISFRDTILIATSNAGADRIRQYIEAGYQIEQFSEQIQNELIQSQQFKPEFLNRFDEIAVFRPLTKDELLKVVSLILKGINKNLATQKVFVNVEDEAQRLLVDAGYDPRLGARPMRRIVQKTVENIVAEKMLSGEMVPGSGINLNKEDIQNSLAKQ